MASIFLKKEATSAPQVSSDDRAGSALAEERHQNLDWKRCSPGIEIFFFSGVTPAISPSAEQAVFDALKYCHTHGITVICDLNYRAKMWSREKAQSVMKELMQYVDLCIANDEDFEATLGIHAFDGDMATASTRLRPIARACRKFRSFTRTAKPSPVLCAI